MQSFRGTSRGGVPPCPQFCPQYRRHTMTRDHTRRTERHGPNRADDTFRHLLYSDEHGRLGLRNRQSWTFESPTGNGPQMTTVLTTTRTDMSVLSRTHGRCHARREGRQRVGANEYERAATYSYTAWRRFESCRGHQTRNHAGLHGWGRTQIRRTPHVQLTNNRVHLRGAGVQNITQAARLPPPQSRAASGLGQYARLGIRLEYAPRTLPTHISQPQSSSL